MILAGSLYAPWPKRLSEGVLAVERALETAAAATTAAQVAKRFAGASSLPAPE